MNPLLRACDRPCRIRVCAYVLVSAVAIAGVLYLSLAVGVAGLDSAPHVSAIHSFKYQGAV